LYIGTKVRTIIENGGYSTGSINCRHIIWRECCGIKYIMDDSNYVAKNSSLAMLYRDLRPDEIVDDVGSGTAVYDGIVKDTRRTVKGDDRVYVQHTDEFVEQYVQYLESEDDSYVQYYIGKSAP